LRAQTIDIDFSEKAADESSLSSAHMSTHVKTDAVDGPAGHK